MFSKNLKRKKDLLLILKQSLQNEDYFDNESEASFEASIDNIDSNDFIFVHDTEPLHYYLKIDPHIRELLRTLLLLQRILL